MRKILVLAALLSLLAGCKPTEEKAIELAQKEIAQDLKDPDSAKFRFTRVAKTKEQDDGSVFALICGQVNAKNGFGAYVGFHSFLIDINMKEKGFFSKGVTYSVGRKHISTDDLRSDIIGYPELCGEDS